MLKIEQESYDSVFCNFLRYRNKHDFPNLIIIVGDKRMGKSYLAVAIAQALDSNFNADKIVFDISSFLNFVEKAEPCYLVYDEIGITCDKYFWYTAENKIFGQVSETYGKLGINLIMTLPKLEFLSRNALSMVDFFINMLSRGVGRIYINTKRPLDIQGRFRVRRLGHILNLQPTRNLWIEYEKKKTDYLKTLTKSWKQLYDTSKMKELLVNKKIRNKFEQDTNPAYLSFDTKELLA